MELRHHCRDNESIKGVCNYVRKLEVTEPDPDAKVEVIESEYFDKQNFKESEPELYNDYLKELLNRHFSKLLNIEITCDYHAKFGKVSTKAISVLSMRAMGYELETAISDLIDNSIFAKARNIFIEYSWNSADPWVMISDDGEERLRKC